MHELTYVSYISNSRGTQLDGPEGMLTVEGESSVRGIPRLDLVIDVKKIKGMAHLIAINNKNWIINN